MMRVVFPWMHYRLSLTLVTLVVMGASSAFGAEIKNVVSAQAHFESKCARCHGAGGKGNGFMAIFFRHMFSMPDLTDPAYMQARSDDALFRAIKQGSKGGMPAYGLKLSEPEIKDIVVYVRSFVRTR